MRFSQGTLGGQQITLYTGVLYVANQAPMPFCTISPSRRHDPSVIWAHLDPILQFVAKDHTEVHNLYYFSDGPATQHKNHTSFLHDPHTRVFKTVMWNFF